MPGDAYRLQIVVMNFEANTGEAARARATPQRAVKAVPDRSVGVDPVLRS